MSSGRPEIGLLLPNTGRSASGAAIRDFARRADEVGVDSLWVGDHVALTAAQETGYPYSSGHAASYEVPAQLPFLEAFTSLGFAAAVTKRCRLGLGVGILPYRHPLLWAKLVGTIQLLSDRRFNFGVGVGWMREEFESLDASFAHRGSVSNEILRILEVLREEPGSLTFHGEHFHIDDMASNPATRAPWDPPIWVGGNGRAAAARVVRFGDVWFPHLFGSRPENVRVRLREMQEAAASSGRLVELRAAVHAPWAVQSQVGGDPWETGMISGPVGYVAEILHQYRESGVQHVTLAYGGSGEKRIDLAEQVLAAFG